MRALTREQFIERAKKNKVSLTTDYSKFVYKNTKTEAIFICTIDNHGDYPQEPQYHMRGHGCPKCQKTRNLTDEEYKERCRKIHNNKYEYPEPYVNREEFMNMICDIHGKFRQQAGAHMAGFGCWDCGRIKQAESQKGRKGASGILLLREEYLKRAIKKWGNKFDYSLLDYRGSKYKVWVICKVLGHGKFEVRAFAHLKQDCMKCFRASRKLGTFEFKRRGKIVHKNRYDYPNSEYIDSDTLVAIECPDHSEFFQKAKDHLAGHGCPDCGGTKKSNTEEFIKKAKIVHPDRNYSYKNSKYTKNSEKLIIDCNDHGEFWQTPSDHLSGAGCPYCRTSKMETAFRKVLTELKLDFTSQASFEDLKYNRKLKVDFLINGSVFVELHGEQHFHKRSYYNSEKGNLEKTKHKDMIKLKYAYQNKYSYLCLSYKVDIEKYKKILISFLKNKSPTYSFYYDEIVYWNSNKKIIPKCLLGLDFEIIEVFQDYFLICGGDEELFVLVKQPIL